MQRHNINTNFLFKFIIVGQFFSTINIWNAPGLENKALSQIAIVQNTTYIYANISIYLWHKGYSILMSRP